MFLRVRKALLALWQHEDGLFLDAFEAKSSSAVRTKSALEEEKSDQSDAYE